MKSELRNRIEDLSQLYAVAVLDKTRAHSTNAIRAAGEKVESAWAALSAALADLDAMAERDALWNAQRRLGIDVNQCIDGKWRTSVYDSDLELVEESDGDTPLAAVQALVAKIEGGE